MTKNPILTFRSPTDFSLWLEQNHSTHPGIWLRVFKKASGQPTVTYAEALEEALCFGWIDGQKQKGDEDFWLQKFTPRGARSVWSKVNTGHVERLEREGRLRPAGKATIEAAKADGRWEKAYQSSRTFEMPEDFLHEVRKFASAFQFYESLNKTNRYAIFYRLQSAKRPETRQRRLQEFVEMLKRGEKLH